MKSNRGWTQMNADGEEKPAVIIKRYAVNA
jgi:hypothetical protein